MDDITVIITAPNSSEQLRVAQAQEGWQRAYQCTKKQTGCCMTDATRLKKLSAVEACCCTRAAAKFATCKLDYAYFRYFCFTYCFANFHYFLAIFQNFGGLLISFCSELFVCQFLLIY
jgi:hypothetical protein